MAKIIQVIVAFVLTFLLVGCNSQSGNTKSGLHKDDSLTNDHKVPTPLKSPRRLVKNYGANDSNRLFAFVGEKISVEPLAMPKGSFDNGFKAKYAILKKVYGNFLEDTIEFLAFDHYGKPPFSMFKNVLLYVSADSGTYYQQKYMYNDVYKTKDGRWAGIYAFDDYAHTYNKHTKIKPVKVEFAERVAFPTRMVDDDGQKLVRLFPKPYFKTVGDSGIAIYGNYVEDLFELKKSGYLSARALFEPTAQQEEDMVESRQPEPAKTPPGKDELKLLKFWKIFVASLKEPGTKNFRNIALDSLYICDSVLSTDDFIGKCFEKVIDQEVQKRITDKTKLEYISNEVDFNNIVTSNARKAIVRVGNEYRVRSMYVTCSTRNDHPPTMRFDFIETRKGYRLYSIDYSSFKECCQDD